MQILQIYVAWQKTVVTCLKLFLIAEIIFRQFCWIHLFPLFFGLATHLCNYDYCYNYRYDKFYNLDNLPGVRHTDRSIHLKLYAIAKRDVHISFRASVADPYLEIDKLLINDNELHLNVRSWFEQRNFFLLVTYSGGWIWRHTILYPR